MSWVVYAALAACFESLKDLLLKRVTGRKLSSYSLTWGMLFFSALFYLPVAFFTPIPELGEYFWIILLTHATLLGCGLLFYVKALEISEVSLCVPLVMFTPLFLLIASPLMVNEYPSVLGVGGVLLIVVGSYFLNISQYKRGYLAPLKALFEQRGPRLMLVFAFLMGITSNLDKLGLQKSTPEFYMACVMAALPVVTGVLFSFREPQTIPNALRWSRAILPAALANTLMAYCHFTAMSLGLVVYVIAIKRTSVVMSILGSNVFFKEQGFKERLIAALIMLAGVVLISTASM